MLRPAVSSTAGLPTRSSDARIFHLAVALRVCLVLCSVSLLLFRFVIPSYIVVITLSFLASLSPLNLQSLLDSDYRVLQL